MSNISLWMNICFVQSLQFSPNMNLWTWRNWWGWDPKENKHRSRNEVDLIMYWTIWNSKVCQAKRWAWTSHLKYTCLIHSLILSNHLYVRVVWLGAGVRINHGRHVFKEYQTTCSTFVNQSSHMGSIVNIQGRAAAGGLLG